MLLTAPFGPESYGDAKKMQHELRAAMRQDRQEHKSGKNAKKIVLATVQGCKDGPTVSYYKEKMSGWMKYIRDRYRSVVICQTARSVDNTGASISGLNPFTEYKLMVNLYPHEMENLERIAMEMVKDDAHILGVQLSATGVSNLFIEG